MRIGIRATTSRLAMSRPLSSISSYQSTPKPKKIQVQGPSVVDRQQEALRTVDFEALGIGGMDVELKTLFRRAFASRMVPQDVALKFGMRHTKGILVHGPPGTGKTLLARQIASLLGGGGSERTKLVAGPEIFKKLVGESEERVRDLFGPAEREWQSKGEESPLHVIILDEMDSIARER
jgi:vesicle-fusing ATPase